MNLKLIEECWCGSSSSALVYCDSEEAQHIVANFAFHERMEHIEVDCYFIHKKIEGIGD